MSHKQVLVSPLGCRQARHAAHTQAVLVQLARSGQQWKWLAPAFLEHRQMPSFRTMQVARPPWPELPALHSQQQEQEHMMWVGCAVVD